jgi:hypothetical protein
MTYYRFLNEVETAPTPEILVGVGEKIRLAKEAGELLDDEIALLRRTYNKRRDDMRAVKVSGTSFRQDNVRLVRKGDGLEMRPDPFGRSMTTITGDPRSEHLDPTAVMLVHQGRPVGYIPKDIAAQIFEAVSKAGTMTAMVHDVVGGTAKAKTVGLRIILPEMQLAPTT